MHGPLLSLAAAANKCSYGDTRLPLQCQEHGCYMVLLATGTPLKVDHIDLDAPMEVYIVMLCNDCCL
jgi:hypothetical protein